MPTFLTQIRFTDRGVNALHQSPERAAEFRLAVESAGGKMIGQYWAMGDCDGIALFTSPSDEVAAQLLVELAQKGFVRTSTLLLLDENEFLRTLRSTS